ncbi:hypothetical protein [Rhodobacter lacus]|uniref:Excinuclease ABC subunit A n=1 Tax=Rhodobacter lacus TaxID=1641972 RepID=A0ABW5A8J8_9RHOB
MLRLSPLALASVLAGVAFALPQALQAEPPAPGRLAPQPAEAPSECKIMAATGDRFCRYGNRWRLENVRAPDFAPGDPFPVYEHSMLMELRAYDLPAVDGPWRYYLRDGVIYRVSADTHRVLEVIGRRTRR